MNIEDRRGEVQRIFSVFVVPYSTFLQLSPFIKIWRWQMRCKRRQLLVFDTDTDTDANTVGMVIALLNNVTLLFVSCKLSLVNGVQL